MIQNITKLFNPYIPVFTQVDHRAGKKETSDTQWRKPLFVLINGGTRSGKELVTSHNLASRILSGAAKRLGQDWQDSDMDIARSFWKLS